MRTNLPKYHRIGLEISILLICGCVGEGHDSVCCKGTSGKIGDNVPAYHSHVAGDTVPSTAPFLPFTDWLEPSQRDQKLPELNCTSHEGEQITMRDLLNRPVAFSFIYTRCQNPNKCARVAAAMAQLQNEVEKAGLGRKVRLILASYDPEYDTAQILKQYGSAKGLRLGENALMLRPDPKQKDKLFDELQVAVNFNSSGVNIHGIQLFLADKQGRLARIYHTLIWDNAKVLEDLRRLAAE